MFLHSEFHKGSSREVSDKIDVKDLEELDFVVCGILKAINVFAKIIASLR